MNIMQNIGRAKYVINYRYGEHNDGSPFFAIAIHKNKRDHARKLKELQNAGYTLTN